MSRPACHRSTGSNRRRWPSARLLRAGPAACALGLMLAACTGEDATPIDPANPPTTEASDPATPHQLEPTAQMRDLARRQCLDDPDLDTGYVQAVDPVSDEVLTEFSIDCADVRS